jgi:hypothetical protein
MGLGSVMCRVCMDGPAECLTYGILSSVVCDWSASRSTCIRCGAWVWYKSFHTQQKYWCCYDEILVSVLMEEGMNIGFFC